MDDDLKNGLWNIFQVMFLDKVGSEWISLSNYKHFFDTLWLHYFKLPLDTLSDDYETTYKQIRGWYFSWQWYEIYDFIEFLASIQSHVDIDKLIRNFNFILEREMSGYRFVGNKIVQITDKNEIYEIEEAIINSKKTKYSGVYEHLTSALKNYQIGKNRIIEIRLRNQFLLLSQ